MWKFTHIHTLNGEWWMVKETERARAIHKKAFNALILEKSGHTKNLSTYTQWIYPHYRRCKTWNAYFIENIRKTLWTKCMIRCLTIRLENTSAILSPWIFIWAVFFLLNNAATELNIFQTITQSTHALCTHSYRTGTITSTNIPHKHIQFNISNHIFPSFSHVAASFSHIFHIIVVSRYTKTKRKKINENKIKQQTHWKRKKLEKQRKKALVDGKPIRNMRYLHTLYYIILWVLWCDVVWCGV